MDPVDYHNPTAKGVPLSAYDSRTSLDAVRPYRDETPPPSRSGRPPWRRQESHEGLVSSAASMDRNGPYRNVSRDDRFLSSSPPEHRQPTVPDMSSHPGRAY